MQKWAPRTQRRCPPLSRKIIALDKSNRDYDFGYNDGHEDHMLVGFILTV